jgi:hypothetical protein
MALSIPFEHLLKAVATDIFKAKRSLKLIEECDRSSAQVGEVLLGTFLNDTVRELACRELVLCSGNIFDTSRRVNGLPALLARLRTLKPHRDHSFRERRDVLVILNRISHPAGDSKLVSILCSECEQIVYRHREQAFAGLLNRRDKLFAHNSGDLPMGKGDLTIDAAQVSSALSELELIVDSIGAGFARPAFSCWQVGDPDEAANQVRLLVNSKLLAVDRPADEEWFRDVDPLVGESQFRPYERVAL